MAITTEIKTSRRWVIGYLPSPLQQSTGTAMFRAMKSPSKSRLASLTMVVAGLSPAILLSASPGAAGKNLNMTSKVEHIRTEGATVALSWSPDGSAIATASNFGTTVAIYKANSDLVTKITGYGGGPLLQTDIGFIHNDKEIVYPVLSPKDNTALFDVMDVATGKIVHRQTSSGVENGGDVYTRRASKIVVSQDQSKVAAITSLRSVSIFDTATWSRIRQYKLPDRTGPSAMAFSDDGKRIAIGLTNGAVIVAPISNPGEEHLYPGFSDRKNVQLSVGSIAFKPSRNEELLIASGIGNVLPSATSANVANGTVEVLNLQTGSLIESLDTNSPLIRSAIWVPGSDAIWFVDGSPKLFRWSLTGSHCSLTSETIDQNTLALSAAPTGSQLGIAGENGVEVFNIH